MDGRRRLHVLAPCTRRRGANAAPLAAALVASAEAGLPDISVSPAQAKLLSLWCRVLGVTHALEVGTLGGYSATWLASQNPGLRVTTVEFDAHHAAVARATSPPPASPTASSCSRAPA